MVAADDAETIQTRVNSLETKGRVLLRHRYMSDHLSPLAIWPGHLLRILQSFCVRVSGLHCLVFRDYRAISIPLMSNVFDFAYLITFNQHLLLLGLPDKPIIYKLSMFAIPVVRALSALFTSLALFTYSSLVRADKAGYVTPTSGTASTTQFNIGPEFGSGTSCGATAFPNGARTNGAPGGGPGFLYAAVNQLHFGANPAGKASPLQRPQLTPRRQ